MIHNCEVINDLINQAIEVGRARQIADDAAADADFEAERLAQIAHATLTVIPCNLEKGSTH